MRPPCQFIAVPKVVLARRDLRARDQLLLGFLITGADDNGDYRAKVSTLAARLGVRERCILGGLDRLEKLGLIGVKRTGRASSYHVNSETLLELNKSAHQKVPEQTGCAQMCRSDPNTDAWQVGTRVQQDLTRTSSNSTPLNNPPQDGAAPAALADHPVGQTTETKQLEVPPHCTKCRGTGVYDLQAGSFTSAIAFCDCPSGLRRRREQPEYVSAFNRNQEAYLLLAAKYPGRRPQGGAQA